MDENAVDSYPSYNENFFARPPNIAPIEKIADPSIAMAPISSVVNIHGDPIFGPFRPPGDLT